MDVSTLTKGAIAATLGGNGPPRPIVQVLNVKEVKSNDPSSISRFRLQLSDGQNYQPGMLATQMNHLVHQGDIDKYCILQIEKMHTSIVQSRKIMILISVNILHKGGAVGRKLGEPVALELSTDQSCKVPATPPNIRAPLGSNQSNYRPQQQTTPTNTGQWGQRPPPQMGARQPANTGTVPTFGQQNNFYGGNVGGAAPNRPNTGGTPNRSVCGAVVPIASLNPYQNKWTIKVRVASKGPIREYSNARGQGRILSVELVDHSGDIRATAFNDECDRLHPLLEANKIYLISRGRLKPANKSFTTCTNDYELTFNSDTVVEECNDGTNDLPSLSYNFKTIAELEQVQKDSMIDVIGVCSSVAELTSVTTRTTNKRVSKRDVTLLDKTGRSVVCTFWGAEAEGFDGSGNPVLAIKGARVSDFNGVSLSTIASSTVTINPDIQEAHQLRGWYDSYGKDQQVQSLTGTGGGGGGATPYLTLPQVKDLPLGHKEKGDYFNCHGTITHIKKENIIYKACPSSECNKKVNDDSSGQFYCEKCAQNYSDFKYRIIMKINVSDYGNNVWLDCFNETAETILNTTAANLGALKDAEDSEFDNIIDEANLKEFIFKVRAKTETYNEEVRARYACIQVTPISFVQDNKLCLDLIHAILKGGV